MLKFILKYYLPINLLFDVFTSTLWQSGSNAATIRGGFLILILFSAWMKNRHHDVYRPFIFYTLYITLLLFYATDFIESLRLSTKVLTTIWAFPIFFVYGYLYSDKVIKRNIFWMSIILIGNYAISTIYGIGHAEYSDSNEFLVGSLSDSWLIFTYTLFLYIIILKTKNLRLSTKTIYLIMFAMLVVLILLGMKRTAIIVFFVGIIIFLFLEKLNFKSILTFAMGFIFILIILNQYSDVLENQFYARGDRVQGKARDIIESEYRYFESIYVWEKVFSFKNAWESIFGLEAYNSRNNYGPYSVFGDRYLHIDYNIIVNTTGLFGLFFYFYLFYYIYKRFKERKYFLDYKYHELFLVIFLTQFLASIGGQMLSVTYGSIKFAFMAVALNKFTNQSK